MDVKWIDFFKALGLTTAGQILLLILIGFFGKKLIEYFIGESIELKKAELTKELESFKQSLSSENQAYKLELEKNLEGYKNTLQQIAYEHETRFSKLHEDRAETIKILFAKLIKMEKSMTSLMAPFQAVGEPSKDEKSRIAAEDGNDFLDFYHKNEILFNEETCDIINKLNESFKTAFNKFTSYRPGQLIPTNGDPYFDILKNDVVLLKKKLHVDFRKLLGVK